MAKLEAVIAKKETGKDYTFGEIIVNCFCESIDIGRGLPWKYWTKAEISKVKKQLQSEQ